MINSAIWLLVDDRAGTRGQAIALAEAIGLDYQLKNISYNIFGGLPNFLLAFSPLHIGRANLKSLTSPPPPKLIISAGRRCAPVALYLKRLSTSPLKIIQIMRPESRYKQFDLIILPEHDRIYQNTANIVRITGALNKIASTDITSSRAELRKLYPQLNRFIAVIIGGDTKNYQFTAVDAAQLSLILAKIAEHHAMPLFISFSRRTPQHLKTTLSNKFELVPNIIYDPQHDRPNPYLGLLSCADYIITTADSVSICSEAGSSGKPLYIFSPANLKSFKHSIFIQKLVDLKIARKLDNSVNILENYLYSPLDEARRIAKIIKSKFTELF